MTRNLKRSASAGLQSDREKAKKFYKKQSAFEARGVKLIESGTAGILATCAMKKEKLSVKELYSVLNEYADKIYGPEDANNDGTDNDNADELKSISFEDAMANELAMLKEQSGKNNASNGKTKRPARRFQSAEVGSDCCVFIKVGAPVIPSVIVRAIFEDIEKTGISKMRFTQRLHPLDRSCLGNVNEIEKLAKNVLKAEFGNENQTGRTFGIVFKRRLSEKPDRMEVIKCIASVVKELGDQVGIEYSVNLENPDLTIIIEVIKGVCGIAVVKDYARFKKYGIFPVAEGSSDNPTSKAAKNNSKKPSDVEKEVEEQTSTVAETSS